jgi:hypothetical protein
MAEQQKVLGMPVSYQAPLAVVKLPRLPIADDRWSFNQENSASLNIHKTSIGSQ